MSETRLGSVIDTGSFFASKVTAGHEIESEVGLCKNGNATSHRALVTVLFKNRGPFSLKLTS